MEPPNQSIIQKMTKGGLKRNILQQNDGTTGLSKGRKILDDGVSIVLAQRNLHVDLVMQVEQKVTQPSKVEGKRSLKKSHSSGSEKLRSLSENSFKGKVQVWNLMLDPEIYYMAYESIKGNQQIFALNLGVDGSTLKEQVNFIIKAIKNHTYKFKSIFRLQDKIVQKVMAIILEAIFEPIFRESSHGFRKDRSTHTALKSITYWKDIDWFIEGDIHSNFDEVNHQVLAQKLQERIEDKQFMDLYWRAVKASFVEMASGKRQYGEKGMPLNGELSPILSNIYLHSFDIFLEVIHTKISNKRTNTLTNQMQYVRYADDFVIGIRGSKDQAKEVWQMLKDFLERHLKLEVNVDKMLITKRAKFLGVQLKSHCYWTPEIKNGKRTILLAPIDGIVRRLAEQGICRMVDLRKKEVVPLRKTAWIYFELEEIIIKYNQIWQEILNYYSFVWNRSQLNWVQYILQHSAACTILNKLRLNSRRQVFKKFGKKLTISYLNVKGEKMIVEFQIQEQLARTNKFNINPMIPFETFFGKLRTRSRLE